MTDAERERAAVVRRAVLHRISASGDMHIRVRDTTLESLLRQCGLGRWETNMSGDDGYRMIDAVALEALCAIASGAHLKEDRP